MALSPVRGSRIPPTSVARLRAGAASGRGALRPRDGASDVYEMSDRGKAQMAAITRAADKGAGGKAPLGRCYEAVWNYISRAGYGNMPAADVPGDYSTYAKQFAYYADANLTTLGLRKLPLDNPYEAPPGALVVVKPGTPGTSHPVAGDITVALGNGRFLNDGEMGYGGPEYFPPGNDLVLGIYVPR